MPIFLLFLLMFHPLAYGDDDEEGYRFRFKIPSKLVEVQGQMPASDHGDHGHESMSPERLKEKQKAERGPVRVTATAYDAEGALIVRKTVTPDPEDEEAEGTAEMAGVAAALANDAQANCDEAADLADKANAGIRVAGIAVNALSSHLEELEAIMADIQRSVSEIGDLHSRVQSSGEQIAVLRDKTGESAIRACQAAEQMKDEEGYAKLTKLAQEAALASRETAEGGQQAHERATVLKNANARLQELKAKATKLMERTGRLFSATQRLGSAAERSSAGIEHGRVITKTARGQIGQLSRLQVQPRNQQLAGCADKSDALLTEAEEHFEELQEQIKEQQERLQGLRDNLPEDLVASIREAANDAAITWDLSQTFMGNIDQHVDWANLCARLAVDLAPEQNPLYVICHSYFPKMPDKLPEGMKYQQWASGLTVGKANWVASEQPMILAIAPEAQTVYPREMFVAGASLSSDIFIEGHQGGGNFQLNGAVLLKIATIYDDEEVFSRKYGTLEALGDQGTFLMLFVDDSGTFSHKAKIDGQSMSYSGGPLIKGWSENMKKRNLTLFKKAMQIFDCFIVTEVYQAWHNPQLRTLRAFRDGVLLQSEAGRNLVDHYYRLGPGWAQQLRPHPWIKQGIKAGVESTVWLLKHIDWDSPWVQWSIEQINWLFDPLLEHQKPPETVMPRPLAA